MGLPPITHNEMIIKQSIISINLIYQEAKENLNLTKENTQKKEKKITTQTLSVFLIGS